MKETRSARPGTGHAGPAQEAWLGRAIRADLKLPKPAIFALGLVVVGLLGVLDYLTGYEVRFSFFYIFPIAFVGWYGGSRWAWILAAAVALVGVGADMAAGLVYSHASGAALDVVLMFAGYAAIVLLISRLKAVLERESAHARSDALTGAANSRHFMEALEAEISRARRYAHGFSLAYLDLDGFKAVNDTGGHDTGDEVLRGVVEAMRGSIRESDVLARMGGDEFALLLPETDLADAEAVVRKLHAVLRETAHGSGFVVGFSAGVAGCSPTSEGAQAILRFADRLMYEAKAEGKGRVRARVFEPHERREALGAS